MARKGPHYRVIPHTADTGIEADAPTLAELYATCAYAMFAVMVDLDELVPTDQLVVRVAGSDPADVLVGLLSELLAVADGEGVICCTFEVAIASETETELHAGTVPMMGVELCGPPVKAVTYHELDVVRLPGGWRARVLLDV